MTTATTTPSPIGALGKAIDARRAAALETFYRHARSAGDGKSVPGSAAGELIDAMLLLDLTEADFNDAVAIRRKARELHAVAKTVAEHEKAVAQACAAHVAFLTEHDAAVSKATVMLRALREGNEFHPDLSPVHLESERQTVKLDAVKRTRGQAIIQAHRVAASKLRRAQKAAGELAVLAKDRPDLCAGL